MEEKRLVIVLGKRLFKNALTPAALPCEKPDFFGSEHFAGRTFYQHSREHF